MTQDRSTTPLLPDCMMPDGAEPCAAYRQLEEKYAYIVKRAAHLDAEQRLSSASETAPPTDVDELIAELKSALEELRIAGAWKAKRKKAA
jgi:hypothetical protein